MDRSEKRAAALASELGEVEKATLTTAVPAGDSFLYELKYDGYRFLAIKVGEAVTLLSRNGHDWAHKFPAVVEAVRKLAPAELVVDGEVCALDARGVPVFSALQNAGARSRLVYFVFDLLWQDGEDLRGEPIEARRVQLERLLKHRRRAKTGDVLLLSAAVEGDPKKVLAVACAQGFEGIIAKRRASPYRPGRSKEWLKIKCTLRQEFAIAGYLPYKGTSGLEVGSLLLAIATKNGFEFAGKVGTGFSNAVRKDLARRMEKDRVDESPVHGMPRERAARVVKPRLVAEVSFTEWTEGGRIRHPSFRGLRIDKSPAECFREKPKVIRSA